MSKNEVFGVILGMINSDIEAFQEAIFDFTNENTLSKLTKDDIKELSEKIRKKYIISLLNIVAIAKENIKDDNK